MVYETKTVNHWKVEQSWDGRYFSYNSERDISVLLHNQKGKGENMVYLLRSTAL